MDPIESAEQCNKTGPSMTAAFLLTNFTYNLSFFLASSFLSTLSHPSLFSCSTLPPSTLLPASFPCSAPPSFHSPFSHPSLPHSNFSYPNLFRCIQRLVVLTTEWLPWLQTSWGDSGYQRFSSVWKSNLPYNHMNALKTLNVCEGITCLHWDHERPLLQLKCICSDSF